MSNLEIFCSTVFNRTPRLSILLIRAFFELLSSTIVAVSLDELSHDKTKQIKIEVNFMFNNFIYFLYLDLREYLAKCVYLTHLALLRYILFEHCITVFVLGLVQNLN